MKGNNYKKERTSLCHYCDYSCRKGHKCKYYKKYVKSKFCKKRRKYNGN